MSTIASRLSLRGRVPTLRLGSGISAIIVKELRGRMRGRRAFIIIMAPMAIARTCGWGSWRRRSSAAGSTGSGAGGGGGPALTNFSQRVSAASAFDAFLKFWAARCFMIFMWR